MWRIFADFALVVDDLEVVVVSKLRLTISWKVKPRTLITIAHLDGTLLGGARGNLLYAARVFRAESLGC